MHFDYFAKYECYSRRFFLLSYKLQNHLKRRCIVSCHSRSQIPSLFLAGPVSCKKELLRVTAAILSFSQLMTIVDS